jgi:hypothetical protein
MTTEEKKAAQRSLPGAPRVVRRKLKPILMGWSVSIEERARRSERMKQYHVKRRASGVHLGDGRSNTIGIR